MTIAIYAGTFDPLTFGHIDIIERSLQMFDDLIIAVALNDSKNTLFSLQERIDIIELEIANNRNFLNKNIICKVLINLLVDFAKNNNCGIIIRVLEQYLI